MPRFYFHVLDGSALFDDSGLELPGIDAAMKAAVRFAGAVLREGIADDLWKGSPRQVLVSDSPSPTGSGRTLLTLTLSAQVKAVPVAYNTPDVVADRKSPTEFAPSRRSFSGDPRAD
jgi:hypothetical protein